MRFGSATATDPWHTWNRPIPGTSVCISATDSRCSARFKRARLHPSCQCCDIRARTRRYSRRPGRLTCVAADGRGRCRQRTAAEPRHVIRGHWQQCRPAATLAVGRGKPRPLSRSPGPCRTGRLRWSWGISGSGAGSSRHGHDFSSPSHERNDGDCPARC